MEYENPDRQQDLPGPLDGIRIVEYGVFHAGPGADAILGDLGADVIKIESGIGDPERYWRDVGGMDFTLPSGDSLTFETSNRNKKGIYVDIETDMGRNILHRLIQNADVFLTNLRKSTIKKIGIDYETISKVNPKIIHASVSGYGQEGPMSDLGAFDPLGMARSGMLFVTGSPYPVMMHLGILDQATAIAASHAILTALVYRERHGIGQAVHVSLFSTGIWLLYFNFLLSTFLKIDKVPTYDRSYHSPLRNAFLCKDDKIVMATHHPESRYWGTFCEATGQRALIDDPRFSTDAARKANCPELIGIFDQIFLEKTRDEWMEIFQKCGLMISSVQTIAEVSTDPQAIINNYVVPFDHPKLGRVMIPGYPAHFSACRAGTKSAAPDMGEHTDIVMKELGFSDQEIIIMKNEGVIK